MCGNHNKVPTKKAKQKVTRDRSRRGVGEGGDSNSESSSDDNCKPYYDEEKPLQAEAMGKSPSVPDEMAKIIASSNGIAEQAYRELYVDIGCAKQSPDRAMEQVGRKSVVRTRYFVLYVIGVYYFWRYNSLTNHLIEVARSPSFLMNIMLLGYYTTCHTALYYLSGFLLSRTVKYHMKHIKNPASSNVSTYDRIEMLKTLGVRIYRRECS